MYLTKGHKEFALLQCPVGHACILVSKQERAAAIVNQYPVTATCPFPKVFAWMHPVCAPDVAMQHCSQLLPSCLLAFTLVYHKASITWQLSIGKLGESNNNKPCQLGDAASGCCAAATHQDIPLHDYVQILQLVTDVTRCEGLICRELHGIGHRLRKHCAEYWVRTCIGYCHI